MTRPHFDRYPSGAFSNRFAASRFVPAPCVVATCVLLAIASAAPSIAFGQKTSARGEAALKVKFTRTADEVFQAVVSLAAGVDKELDEPEQLRLYVQAGAWDKLRAILAEQTGDYGPRLLSRILGDLTSYNARAVMLPADVLKLADASPTELESRHAATLGRLLFYAMQGAESRTELMTTLKAGTARLGGTDPANRRAAAAMLASAEFFAEAKEFGLLEPTADTPAAPVDEPAAKTGEENWRKALDAVRKLPSDDEMLRNATLDVVYEILLQSPPDVTQARLRAVIDDRGQQALIGMTLALIGRKSAAAINEFDFHQRKVNLELQRLAISHLAVGTPLDQAPWQMLANLYARNWHNEAQATLKNYPTWLKASSTSRDKYQHVAIEDLLRQAPSDAWLKSLQPQLASAVNAAAARLILTSDSIDRVLPYIRGFVAADPKLAAELANSYLAIWASRHNPNLSADLLKQYRMDNQAIVLTRLEQQTSLKQLGALLGSLDASTRKLLDQDQIVAAFDICHSRAEIYSGQNIVDVFGSIEKLSSSLMQTLLERMRIKLASNWRELSVQRDAATRRTMADVFQLVNDGYAEATRVADVWLLANPGDWRMNCQGGALLSDWSEFAYFQAVAAEDDTDRFGVYLKRSAEALEKFRAGAAAYAAQLPKMKRSDFNLLPYRAWFYGLLGIAQDSDVNLRKGLTKESLREIRKAMLALPGGAAEPHLELFAAMIADNIQKNRIAPEMKYRYLSSAVEITGRRATVYPAEEKVQYYDSLLREIRLLARVDGSPRIAPQGQFGLFVSLVHTADIARESGGFEKYLMNKVRRAVSGKTVTEEPFYRDRFEESLRLALGEFFEIRAIVFADPKSEMRTLETTDGDEPSAAGAAAADSSAGGAGARRGGWRETPLAYLHLVAKDPTVDRIPPLEIEIDFFDRDGKVVLPVPSTPVLIEIAADAPPSRPAEQIDVTEIVDARDMADRRLKMDVVATANGLVPDLRQLIDLDTFPLPVQTIDEREGLLIRELHNGPDGLFALSERSWTVHFDPTPLLRGAKERVEFSFPKAKSADFKIAFRTYEDLDPVEAAATVTLLEGEAAEKVAEPNYWSWGLGGVAAIAVVVGGGWLALRKKSSAADSAPSPFAMPREVTPFAVASLLHRIGTHRGVALSEQQHDELRAQIATLERSAFAPQASPSSSPQTAVDLRSLAAHWLSIADASHGGAG